MGDSESCRSPGEGVLVVPEATDALSEKLDPSEPERSRTPGAREANAAAVAAAASSTVPVWWFWWRVRVVRRVKVF